MPTKDEIIERMLSGINSEYDKSEGSFIYDAISGVALGLEDAYIQLDILNGKAFVENLVGDELDMKVAEHGVYRKQALAATTYITVTGTDGTVIPVGFRVNADDVYYTSKEEKTITNGTASILVECDELGSVGNVPANTIVNFEPLFGVDSVTNPNPVTNGIDEETDESLKERFFEKVRTPATSGNKQDYINWAKEVTGVGDAKVFPLWNGNGTVKVIIINSNKRAADQSLIDAVTDHIEESRPIGASVTVESAAELPIDVSVDVDLEAGYDLSIVTTNITNALTDYLASIAFQKNYVSYALIGSLILDVEGVSDYRNLTLNGGSSNVIIGDTQVAVVGAVDVT